MPAICIYNRIIHDIADSKLNWLTPPCRAHCEQLEYLGCPRSAVMSPATRIGETKVAYGYEDFVHIKGYIWMTEAIQSYMESYNKEYMVVSWDYIKQGYPEDPRIH